jgi:hypothetical protein
MAVENLIRSVASKLLFQKRCRRDVRNPVFTFLAISVYRSGTNLAMTFAVRVSFTAVLCRLATCHRLFLFTWDTNDLIISCAGN